jgi:hypothetical protein
MESDLRDLIPRRIPIQNAKGVILGALVRLNEGDAKNSELVEDITSWRNKNKHFFLTQFEATSARTRHWLESVIFPDSKRVMFLIENEEHLRLGHLGVINLNHDSAELDNMIRGLSIGDPQIMYWAEVSLIEEIFKNLPIEKIILYVLANNWIPITIHKSIGFSIDDKLKVTKDVVDEEVSFLLNSDYGEVQKFKCLLMSLGRESFSNFLAISKLEVNE